MKTRWLYSPELCNKTRESFFQKMLVMAIVIALTVAFLPMSSVLAAPASDAINGEDLGLEWKNKISMVHAETLFYGQVKLFPTDFKSSADMARPYELLAKYGAALKQANEIALKHAGFDETGNVIDEEEALQSLQDLGTQLRTMRGAMEKFEEEGYKLHRAK